MKLLGHAPSKVTVLLLTGLAATGLAAPAAGGWSLSFDSKDELNALIPNGSSGSVVWSEDNGVSASPGRLNLTLRRHQAKTLYHSVPFSADKGIEASYCFLGETLEPSDYPMRIALGISPITTENFSGDTTPIIARLFKNAKKTQAVLEIRDASIDRSRTTEVTLRSGVWYRLKVIFMPHAEKAIYEVTATLEDLGESGAYPPMLISVASGKRRAPDLFFERGKPVPVHVGFMAQSNGGGAFAVDDFIAHPPSR